MIAELIEDHAQIQAGIWDDHGTDVGQRFIYCGATCVFGSMLRWWGSHELYIDIFANAAFTIGTYVFFFDYVLNKLRGFDFDYFAPPSPHQAWWDSVLSTLHPVKVFTIKALCLLAGILLFIFI